MKAIILARVSDKEQEEGHSLAAQVQRLTDYCHRKDLQIIRIVKIVESSTRGNRKEFTQLVNFAKRQSETIAIVADAVDRIQRSFKESVYLDELIRKGKIELHFNREGMIIGQDAKSSDIMRWDFSVMAAKSYVLQLSDNVKRSVEYKLRNGEIIGQAPPGYLNAINPHTGKKTVVIDPERGPIIKSSLEKYTTGGYSIQELVKMANDMGYRSRLKGRPMTKSSLHSIIQNPFYYGQMLVKETLYDHYYPRLIEKDVYDACQAVRLGWKKKPFQYRSKEYLFRGIITCSVSGNIVTADTKTKTYKDGSKGKWTYLIVTDPDNPDKNKWVREDSVIEQAANVFKDFRIGDEYMSQIREWLKGILDSEISYHKEQLDLLNRKLSNVNVKMRRLTELLVDGALSVEEHAVMRESFIEKRCEIQTKIEQHQKGDDGFVSTLEIILGLLNRSYELFTKSPIYLQRQLLIMVFSNLKLKGGNLEYTLRKPFDQLTKSTLCQKWLADRTRINNINSCII